MANKPNKSDINVNPMLNRKLAFLTICPDNRPTLPRVNEALREIINNAEDEGADDIRIFIDPKSKTFQVKDNGRAFGKHQKEGYFWLFESEKKGAHRQSQKVTGQFGTGRLKTLTFARSISPTSLSDEDGGTFYTTVLTRDGAQKIWEGDTTPCTWKATDRPSIWHLRPGVSGVVIDIKISDEYWKSFPSATRVIDELGKLLSPRLARSVTVNGKALKPRPVLKSFEKSYAKKDIAEVLGAEAAEALGECMVELFMPENPDKDHDDIKLGGAKVVICSIWKLIENLPEPEMAAMIPTLLTSRKHLFGNMFIEGLNGFAAEDRHSLRDTVYDGMHKHLIRFLADVLGPEIEAAYAKKVKEDARKERKKTLSSFSSEFSKAFDRKRSDRVIDEGEDGEGLPEGTVKPESTESTPKLVVRPAWFHCIPGETQDLEVVRHEGCAEEDLEWDDSELGQHGTLAATTGKRTIFTARKLGKCKITVRNRRKPEDNVEIHITVVAEKKLQISPPKVPIEQGASQRFRARNNMATSGNIRWELVDKKRGLRLSNSEGLETVLSVSDEFPLGTYSIACYDADNRGIRDETTFEVVPADTPTIEVDGKLYYLRETDNTQPQLLTLEQDCLFTAGKKGKAGKVEVNFDHADFTNLKKLGGNQTEAMMLMMFESIVLLHLQAEHAAGRVTSVESMTGLYHEYRTTFLHGRAGKK